MGNSASYVPPEKESKIYPHFEADQAAQTGKVFAITGCTTGTGLAAAKLFAKKGASRLFLLNRPSQRAEAQARKKAWEKSDAYAWTSVVLIAVGDADGWI